MTGHQAKLLDRAAQNLGGALAHITMAGTVEAIAAYPKALIVLHRHAIQIRLWRHCLVEGRIKHSDHRRVGHDLLAGVNAHQISGVMQRCQLNVFLDSGNDLIVDDCGGSKKFSALHHTVADSSHFIHGCDDAIIFICQNLNHHSHCVQVILHIGHDNALFPIRLLRQFTAFDTDAFNHSLRDCCLVIHVDQLVFQ
ncbi:hypothetical protein SDC9_157709 [bioreactor metagenome]|uniref:Uncharacterized protein n=1 Tax=bioreactor metagenome TaxID=1076179 RepID=A0A645FD44_9ZZZZ